MITSFYDNVPHSMRKVSGAVFNSGAEAFSRPSSIYVLGLNPGGDPESHAHETVDSHSQEVFRKAAPWSGYRDASWNGRPPGTVGMQPRILHALGRLGLLAHEVPASNLIFVRTKNEESIQGLEQLAEKCWPFHEAIINTLKIRLVLCFGGTCGSWVRKRVGATKLVDTFEEDNNRKWKSQAFANPVGLHVIVATHPARAAWNTAAADPSPMFKRVLLSVNSLRN